MTAHVLRFDEGKRLVAFIARRDNISLHAARVNIARVRRRAVPPEIDGQLCACGDHADCSAYDLNRKETRHFCAECFSRIPNRNTSK